MRLPINDPTHPNFHEERTRALYRNLERAMEASADRRADLGDVRMYIGNAKYHAEALRAELIPQIVEGIMDNARRNGLKERPKHESYLGNWQAPQHPLQSDFQARMVCEGKAIVDGDRVKYIVE
jgi:hypothetical protein